MDFSKLIHGFLLVVTWICQCYDLDLLKLFHSVVKVLPFSSLLLPYKTKLKFDQDFKAWCWSFCFEVKVVKKSKPTMPWVRCAFDNVLCQYLILLLSQVLTLSLTNTSHESCSHTSLRYLCDQKWIGNDGIYFTSGSAIDQLCTWKDIPCAYFDEINCWLSHNDAILLE